MSEFHCPKTGKKKYGTKKEARMYQALSRKHTRLVLYIYKCDHCRHWHLTKRGATDAKDFPLC